MTFKVEDFAVRVQCFGGQPSEFIYTTKDTKGTVTTAGYFNEVSQSLRIGDYVDVSAKIAATADRFIIRRVDDVTAGVAVSEIS